MQRVTFKLKLLLGFYVHTGLTTGLGKRSFQKGRESKKKQPKHVRVVGLKLSTFKT